MSTIAFLGGGRITAALIAGLRGAKFRGRIVVYDRHPEKLKELKRRYAVRAARGVHDATAVADILLLAVRPADTLPLLGAIGSERSALRRRLPKKRTTRRVRSTPPMVVSLAAGIPLRLLAPAVRQALGPRARVARAMPSPACRTGNGLTALAFGPGVGPAARRRVRALFARVGAVLELPERQFDAFTVAYSTSQGYHALAARIRAARALGLPAGVAAIAAIHSLEAAMAAVRQPRASLDALLREAATPGGIAAAVSSALSAAGYDRIVARAFRAGHSRARAAQRMQGQR